MRQHESLNAVHTLRAEKRFEGEVHGAFVATIHEPVVFSSGGIHENRVTAIERKDGQSGFAACRLPVPGKTGDDENQSGRAPNSLFGRKQPAAQGTDEDGVVNADFQPGWRGHVEKCAGNFCREFAHRRHRRHEKPCAVIEQFRHPREPRATDEAAQIAHQRERAQRHGDDVRRR